MAAHGTPEVDLEMGNYPNGGEEVERRMGLLETEIYFQAELYADVENDSSEMKRKKRMARTALTTWNEKTELFGQLVLRSDSEMRSIMNEVYHLVGLYSVFEGVVLTAVATSSRLMCQHLWSPVGLSLFAYFMLVVVAFKKFSHIRDIKVRRHRYHRDMVDIVTLVSELKRRGYDDFDFDRHCKNRPYAMGSSRFWRNVFGLIVPLTIFTAGLVFSLVHILCWS